jgi:signal transduction histidine kinase/ActR/RegA family two-component response regulator
MGYRGASLPIRSDDTGFHHPWHWILVGLLVALLWLGIVEGLRLDRDIAIRDGQTDAANLARAFEENITRTVEAVDQTLLFAREMYVQNRDGLDLTTWMREGGVLNALHVQLAIANANGTVTWSNLGAPPRDDVSVGDRQHFLAQKNNPQDTLYISRPVIGRISNKRTVQFVRKILKADGSFDGVVVASLDPDYLSEFYESISIENGSVALSLSDGTILAQAPEKLGEVGRDVEISRLYHIVRGPDGRERIVSVRHLRQYPLTVAVKLSLNEELSDFFRLRRTYLATGMILSAICVIGSFVIARQRRSLLESRKALSATLESITEGVVMANADGRVLVVNRNLINMLDLPPAIASGGYYLQQIVDWQIEHGEFDSLTAPDVDDLLMKADRFNGFSRYERQRPNGMTIEVRTVTMADGGLVRTFTDISDRKRNEAALSAAQTRAAHAERMQALGQLAGGIAHDFNNILQAVQGAAALIESRAGDRVSTYRFAQMILDVTKRGTSITGRLLAFARRGELRAEPIDCTALLTGLKEVLTHTLGSAIRVEMSIAPNLPPLLSDKGQLETVLVNLATNARDALPTGGLLSISATEIVASGDVATHELQPGRYIRLTIADTGVGMDQITLRRVVEPFFSTKPAGQGTGLGLSMAKGFAEQSGGWLSIESELNVGTNVHLWLPVAGIEPHAATTTETPEPKVREQAHRILLVDDEVEVRQIVAELLEENGYVVLQAADGIEAMNLLERKEPIDVLVTDLSMPRMNGLETIRNAHRLSPDLPALLLTGYPSVGAQLALGETLTGPFTLVRKPVGTDHLIDCIEASLAVPSQS